MCCGCRQLEALQRIEQKLDAVLRQQNSLSRKESKIMTAVKIEQETLDADGAKLSALASDLAQLIAGGTLSDADQSTLQAGIDALSSLDTVQVTPPAV